MEVSGLEVVILELYFKKKAPVSKFTGALIFKSKKLN